MAERGGMERKEIRNCCSKSTQADFNLHIFQGGEQKVQYHVEGGWDVLAVNAVGGIILRGALDREGPGGTIGVAKILGVDRGIPPLTATATLTITLTDVNDSPPLLLPPVTFHVTEDAAPARLGVLTATDEDVWALGHGPPFTFSLASSNPQYIFDLMSLQFDPRKYLSHLFVVAKTNVDNAIH